MLYVTWEMQFVCKHWVRSGHITKIITTKYCSPITVFCHVGFTSNVSLYLFSSHLTPCVVKLKYRSALPIGGWLIRPSLRLTELVVVIWQFLRCIKSSQLSSSSALSDIDQHTNTTILQVIQHQSTYPAESNVAIPCADHHHSIDTGSYNFALLLNPHLNHIS